MLFAVLYFILDAHSSSKWLPFMKYCHSYVLFHGIYTVSHSLSFMFFNFYAWVRRDEMTELKNSCRQSSEKSMSFIYAVRYMVTLYGSRLKINK